MYYSLYSANIHNFKINLTFFQSYLFLVNYTLSTETLNVYQYVKSLFFKMTSNITLNK